MVIGKRKPFLNSSKDIDKLQKYKEQFTAFQKKYEISSNPLLTNGDVC